ncbi:MAG: lysophospholipid acyltransferase family protein [Candidatus Omnitrophica bacterium]|nr:lysophospholipid acyltransferase family protein [Candidatus Omnitrophota bacterium]
MINFILYKIGQAIALMLPFPIAYRVAIFCSDIHYLFANKDRKNVTLNLKTIFPNKNNKEIAQIRLAMARNFAKYLTDFLKFKQIDKNFIENKFTIINRHYLDQAIKQNRGVIALTAHLGNWELGGVVLTYYGYKIYGVALEHSSRLVNNFFDNQRKIKGMNIIPFSHAARQCIKILQQKKILALLGDRDFTEKGGVIVSFFGKNTSFPKGPAALAIRTGALIVPGFVIRLPNDTFKLVFEPPIDPFEVSGTTNNTRQIKFTEIPDKFVRQLTIRYLKIIEKYIYLYPEQWFMFRPFWIKE